MAVFDFQRLEINPCAGEEQVQPQRAAKEAVLVKPLYTRALIRGFLLWLRIVGQRKTDEISTDTAGITSCSNAY